MVSDFIFGGMENTTATTMYEHILLDERAALDVTSDDLIAHELAHQWFGDFVTCRDWSRGLAERGLRHVHGARLAREGARPRRVRATACKHDLASYLGEAHGRYRRPIVCQDYDAPIDLFDRHLYEKGGLVLHMLRTELGDDALLEGRRDVPRGATRAASSRRAISCARSRRSRGRSLGRCFEEMVMRPGHPELEVDAVVGRRRPHAAP